jgi:hypothetical protein
MQGRRERSRQHRRRRWRATAAAQAAKSGSAARRQRSKQEMQQESGSDSRKIKGVGKENKRAREESWGSSKIKKAVCTEARQEGRVGSKKPTGKRARS